MEIGTSKQNVVTHMPAGKYWVGDLCYVLHASWNKVCDKIIVGQSCLNGKFSIGNGVEFSLFGTKYGDGLYYDNTGRKYAVDAGIIGCIRVEHIEEAESYKEGGQFIEFDMSFKCSYDQDGTINIGDVHIDTSGENARFYEDDEE